MILPPMVSVNRNFFWPTNVGKPQFHIEVTDVVLVSPLALPSFMVEVFIPIFFIVLKCIGPSYVAISRPLKRLIVEDFTPISPIVLKWACKL